MVFTVDLSMEAPLVQLAPQPTPLLSAVKHEAFNLFSAFEPGVNSVNSSWVPHSNSRFIFTYANDPRTECHPLHVWKGILPQAN